MKAKQISFEVSAAEHKGIMRLVDRAETLSHDLGRELQDRRGLIMDITACIANGTPLKLEELLVATDSDFTHDVFGIRRHMDRTTGQLGDFFVPRYAA